MVKRRLDPRPDAVQQDALLHRQGRPARHRLRRRGEARRRINRSSRPRSPRRSTWSSSRPRATTSTTRSSRGAATSSPPGSPSRPSARSWSTSRSRRKKGVNEIVVTGPGAPAIAQRGRTCRARQVAVRDKSIQFESLQKRQRRRSSSRARRRSTIRTVPTALEDEDILEMATPGLLKIVVVDDFLREVLEADPARTSRRTTT